MPGFKSCRSAAILILGIETMHMHMLKKHHLDGFKEQTPSAADGFYSPAF